MIMEEVPCPLCGGGTTAPLFQAFDPDRLSDRQYQVVRCCACGLQFLNPRPDVQEIAKFYPEPFYGHKVWSVFTWFFAKLRRRMVERHARHGRILDIGCGDGTFLREMQRAGWDSFGIETSESGFRRATSRLRRNVYRAPLEACSFPNAHFDAITLWGVIEHVHLPQELLKEIRRVLKPSGVLLLTTQNIASLQAQWTKGRWFHLDLPRHLYQFTPDVLDALLRRTGFRVTAASTFFAEYSVPGMLQSLLNLIFPETNVLYKKVKRNLGCDSASLGLIAALILVLPPAALAALFLEGVACLRGRGGAIVMCARKSSPQR